MLARTELTRPNVRAIAKSACNTVFMTFPLIDEEEFIAG